MQQALRMQLEAEKSRLAQELAALNDVEQAANWRELSGYATHAADGATETFDREETQALARHCEGLLGEVERALHKVDLGSYGRCDACGETIDAGRLEALPHATLCLPCQIKVEGRR